MFYIQYMYVLSWFAMVFRINSISRAGSNCTRRSWVQLLPVAKSSETASGLSFSIPFAWFLWDLQPTPYTLYSLDSTVHCFLLWITNKLEIFDTQFVVFLASCPKLLVMPPKTQCMVQANCVIFSKHISSPQFFLLFHLPSSPSYQVPLHGAWWLSCSASFCIHQTLSPWWCWILLLLFLHAFMVCCDKARWW